MQFVSGEWVTDVPVERPKTVVERPDKKMAAVLPFISSEIPDVINFLRRSTMLCGQIPRTIYLLPFKGIDTTEISKVAEKAFGTVGIIQDSEGVNSDWQGRENMRSAAGPNSLFRQATWHFYLLKTKAPWLWLEPDCWPLSERWFYELEQEYFDAAKPFMGVKMGTPSGQYYMNGVGVYPWNAVQYAPLLVQSSCWTNHPDMEVGFDIAGGADVLQKAHITRKIQLMGPLARGNAVARPETVLCHGRIDLSVGEVDRINPAESNRASQKSPDTQTPFLGANGVAGEPQPEVLNETSHAARCVPSHETRAQDPPLYETRAEEKAAYGGISKAIQFNVQELVRLWDNQPHRKVKIVSELRKAKLVPKHFR